MYFPHTPAETEAMLRTIGVKRLEDLFQDVPAAHRFPDLQLPPALTEMEALAEMQDLAWANNSTRDLTSFLGAGAYNHYIPAAVDSSAAARRILYRLHPLPAGDLAGHPAVHLRLSKPDHRLDRHGCQQRLPLRWRHRGSRSGQHGVCQLPG